MTVLLRYRAILAFFALSAFPGPGMSAEPGKPVPDFSLKDTKGAVYSPALVKDKPMMILYFFDAASKPSRESLLALDNLVGKHQGTGLTVWGITNSPKDRVNAFVSKTNPRFPILLDNARVAEAYDARLILPTTCILGPGQRLLDRFQGGGKTTDAMLVRLAERTLQQNQAALAASLSDHVIRADPKNAAARTVKGYAALKSGRLDDAEKTFAGLSKEKGRAAVLGKEGLASVYARKGETGKALKLADEVEKIAPERSYAHVVRGDVLYGRNNRQMAEDEYRKAAEKQGEDFQKAGALNKLGRLYASAGKYEESRRLYDQAVEIDPYYVEAMTNKGLCYEKQGDWAKALDEYRRGRAVSSDDVFSSALAQRAEQMLSYRNDPARKERVDKLVKELSERFRTRRKAPRADEDAWTSRPMVVTLLDLQESGALRDRDGFSAVIGTRLAEQLNASGRVKVVERVLIEQLLEELNLGSSETADPETALKLGKVLAARVIGTGTLVNMPDSTMMSLRLVDTETSFIPKVIIRQIPENAPLKKELFSLSREILASIMQAYPLKAYVVNVDEKRVMINLGSDQGVVTGTLFEVIEEKAAIEYKGKKLKSAPEIVAKLEVTGVEPGLSYCRVVEMKRPLKRDDKAVEKIDESLIKG